MSWNNYVNSGPSDNSSSRPSFADLYRRKYLNSVPGGITPGSILDKNLYEDSWQHGEPRPYPKKRYDYDPFTLYRSNEGEKEYQNDLKNYVKSEIKNYKNEQWGGRKRRTRKARKARKARKSRRR
jgi:hypothetical protein